MARTPLMHTLQQLAKTHVTADHLGISIEEARIARKNGLNRRQLLKGVGSLTASLALAGSLDLSSLSSRADAKSAPRIAIIGAGIAGLNAALTLHDAGYASIVYESSSRIGGRMHSDTTDWLNGQTSEWCGELIDSDHTTIFELIKRFKLKTADLHAAEPKDSQDTDYFFGKYYPQSQADKDFRPIYKILQQQNDAAPSTTYDSYTSTGYKLDHTSIYDWIEHYVPGGHRSPMGRLLDVAYNIEYGRETKEQSSLNLVYLLGDQPTDTGFDIYGSSDERYHIVGGNQQLPTAIAASLPAGSLQLGWRLIAIAKNHDGSINLTFSTPQGHHTKTVDHVILALPFSVLRHIDYRDAGFDHRKCTAINQLGYGTNSKLQLQFDTRYWHRNGPWPGASNGNIYTDIGFQNTWDVTRGQAGPTGIIVDYTGGNVGAAFHPSAPYTNSQDAHTRMYAENFLTQLNQVWPGISAHYTGRATLSCPKDDPNLLGSYSCWLVGQYTLFSGYERVRQGNIHFAGEHCSLDYQGYMEGGAEEGARAAQEILHDYRTTSARITLSVHRV